MTQAAKSLLVTAGMTLLLTVGMVLSLRAAPPPQQGEEATLEITTTHRTVRPGQSFTLTASVRNDEPISMTDVGLTVTLPTTSISHTGPLTQQWAFIEPAATKTHPLSLRILEPTTGTLTLTAALQYGTLTAGPISHSVESIQIVVTPLTSPTPPAAMPSPTPSPSPTPPPTTATPTPPPPAATPVPTLTPPPSGLVQLLDRRGLVMCLLPLLLILGLLLIIVLIRRRRRKPQPPPPPTAPERPHLESVDAAGETGHFDLPPQGVSIGRAPESDLVITRNFPGWETVSHQHARIYQQGTRWILEDLDSTNGIYVNGKRTGRNILQDGWQFSLGGVKFIFHAGTEEVRQ